MSLISTIKSILGLGDSDRAEQGTTVTVERDADVTPESDIGDTPGETSYASEVDATTDESPAAEATESTEDAEDSAVTPDVEEETASADVEGATESADESDDDGTAADEGEPVDTITGIGPAYAERLADAGVHTVADLADADAAELADAIDVSETRIEGWIEQAAN